MDAGYRPITALQDSRVPTLKNALPDIQKKSLFSALPQQESVFVVSTIWNREKNENGHWRKINLNFRRRLKRQLIKVSHFKFFDWPLILNVGVRFKLPVHIKPNVKTVTVIGSSANFFKVIESDYFTVKLAAKKFHYL